MELGHVMGYRCYSFPSGDQKTNSLNKSCLLKSSNENLVLDISVEVPSPKSSSDSARKKTAQQFLQAVHCNSKDFLYLFTWERCSVIEDVPIFVFQVQLSPLLNSKVNIFNILATNTVISVHFLAYFYSLISVSLF